VYKQNKVNEAWNQLRPVVKKKKKTKMHYYMLQILVCNVTVLIINV